MAKCISKNIKTGYSVDFTTDCPLRRKGTPCSYCYVEGKRRAGFNAKKVYDASYNGEIKKMRQDTIDALNDLGGIRLFSFGDYMPEHKEDMTAFLNDCLDSGLKVKAITKSVEFIKTFGNHPAISVIHVSVDNTGDSPVTWRQAKQLRKAYPKVLIRCAIMRDTDIEPLSFADIFTFNHSNMYGSKGYQWFKSHAVAKFAKEYPAKVCCQTGSCATCPIKCGLTLTQ